MFGRDKKKGWDALSMEQKRGIGLAAVVQIGLLAWAMVDWFRRPGSQIRGPKLLWLPLLFVNFVGPLSYLKFGRLSGPSTPSMT